MPSPSVEREARVAEYLAELRRQRDLPADTPPHGPFPPLEEPDPEFVAFPKISRLRREIIITEKIDGTNAAVGVTEDGRVYAQSRKRIITPEADNFGFAAYVREHADTFRAELGPGLHFGEWWGSGIQRGYGLSYKVFSLFNTKRWAGAELTACRVVPVIGKNETFDTAFVTDCLRALEAHGSLAAPGFRNPEGVVVYHPQSNHLYKQTIHGDDHGKEHGA